MHDIERKVIGWLDQHSAKAIRLLKRLIGEKALWVQNLTPKLLCLKSCGNFIWTLTCGSQA